jgi:DNA-binding CsgD family transcriptional regulator
MARKFSGSKPEAKRTAGCIRPLLTEENLDSFQVVICMLESALIWEMIRLKHLDSNKKLREITGFTIDEMLSPDFDFLDQIIYHEDHKIFMQWLDDMSVCRRNEAYDLTFRIKTKSGETLPIIAECIVKPACYNQKTYQYIITGMIFDKKIRPFDQFSECMKGVYLMEYQEIYNSLTDMDLTLLKMICSGYSSAMISDKIFRSKYTVDKYRVVLLKKFHAKNCPDMVAKAINMGIV